MEQKQAPETLSKGVNHAPHHDAPASGEIPALAEDKKKHHRTTGEKIFDAGVYGGIGWITNAAISVVAAVWLSETKSGKKFWDAGAKKANSLFDSVGMKPAAGTSFEQRNTRGHFLTKVTSLMTGGFVLLAPMKWLEDHKSEVVNKLDKKFGNEKEKADAEHMSSRMKSLHKHGEACSQGVLLALAQFLQPPRPR